jgi:primosomal protein N' (replication factor Y)
MPTPEECPGCHGLRLEAHGLGTERLEVELRALFGDVPLARLDRDTIKRRTDLDEQLRRFRTGEARLLIGTQMVTKGHDFPGVTLVGIVAADVSLNFPDFRAAERTFQLLTQVAGRAGRGDKPGLVLVQTYEMEHYAIAAATQHDYEGFAARELAHRRELSYPPFSHLVLLRFEGSSEAATRAAADEEAAGLRERAGVAGGVEVLGPAAAPLARLRGLWRFHILLKGLDRRALRQVIAGLPARRRGDIRRVIDVDPVSML